jgi:hypothetical protein
VTVPALSLLDRSDEPVTLEGYGPIDLETARILAARAPSFVRVLTHPETGAVLSVGRKRYKVPKDLRMWLRVRDGTCRFVGCGRRAERCDVDHTKERQHGGLTEHRNLAHLCRKHHTEKGASAGASAGAGVGASADAWTVVQSPDGSGVLTWTSPRGHTYETRPESEIAPF